MSGYPLLASLARALEMEAAPPSDPPARLERRYLGRAMECPSSWSEIAPPACGLAPGKPLRVWRVADLVVLRGEALSCGLGPRGIRPLPFTVEEVDELVRYLDAEAPAREIALGVAGLLSLIPLLSEDEARYVTASPPKRAPLAALERWRAPYRDEGSVIFQAGPDPIVEIRVDLVQSWIELDELSGGWTPALFVGGGVH